MIFAKQPIPGAVKTRLQPDYDAEQSAAIATEMIRLTLELAVESWPDDIYLYGAPDSDHPLFHELSKRHGVMLRNQRGEDLGERMLAAMGEGIARRGAAAILGCDVPHVSWDVLDDANHELARGHSVLGPTEDGGYYLIGLTDPSASANLFTGISWGGAQVCRQTIALAAKLGIEFMMLPTLTDIDTAADLWQAAQKKPQLKKLLYR